MAELAAEPFVRFDPKYARCVRAVRYGGGQGGGGETGLDEPTIRRIVAAHPGYTAVRGDGQTDFVPEDVEKSRGVLQLLDRLGDPDAPVALAVGDGFADLGMLRMARLGLAPAHADPRLRAAGIEQTRAPYQEGLAQAVGRLIGHSAGACSTCRPPELTPGERLVLTLLSAGQGGRRGLPVATLRLAAARASVAVALR